MGDVEDVEEEAAALSVEPGALPSKGQILTREARNDDIHCAKPGCSVEGENVGPDRCCIQRAVLHARCQDGGWVCFPFKVAADASLDAQVGEPGSQSFAKHSHAGAYFDGMESHVIVFFVRSCASETSSLHSPTSAVFSGW